MTRSRALLTLLILTSTTSLALAQGFSPRPRPGAGQRPATSNKKTGPAEQAPEKADQGDADLPPLPEWPGQKQRKLVHFTLEGYFRFRADIMNNLNLGQRDISIGNTTTRAPYWVPIVERSGELNCAKRANKAVPGGGERNVSANDCPDNTLTGANIRLRLEPTINVTEKVRIKMQVDIFDNLVMGSTPDSLMGAGLSPHISAPIFSESQGPPIAGQNSSRPAILVKRAWAEIELPIGELRLGRMPWHWGMGMMANNGQCWDCNFGDNVDRMLFQTRWAQHTFGVAYDFSGSGPDSLSVDLDPTTAGIQTMYGGQAVDLEQLDDVDQFIAFAGRFDRPDVIRDMLDRGELVLNYGALFVWRKQNMNYLVNNNAAPSGLFADQDSLGRSLREISAETVAFNLWFKLMWRSIYIEMEGMVQFGEIGNVADDVKGGDTMKVMQYGFVTRSQVSFLRDNSLKVGFEFGLASGNTAELYDLNRRRGVFSPDINVTDTLRELRFDPDYHVDLILFREIMGSVANAMYFKPSVQYEYLDTIGARLDIIYSLAHSPVAYPGNDRNLGLEFDVNLYYKNPEEGFYAGLQYGVLIPLAGLDRPDGIYGTQADAEIAQTVQANVVIKF
jgi:uncharacterized protein (TIGR04551 family)